MGGWKERRPGYHARVWHVSLFRYVNLCDLDTLFHELEAEKIVTSKHSHVNLVTKFIHLFCMSVRHVGPRLISQSIPTCRILEGRCTRRPWKVQMDRWISLWWKLEGWTKASHSFFSGCCCIEGFFVLQEGIKIWSESCSHWLWLIEMTSLPKGGCHEFVLVLPGMFVTARDSWITLLQAWKRQVE